jgi:protein SCO1
MVYLLRAVALIWVVFVVSCHKPPETNSAIPTKSQSTNQQIFEGKGIVQQVRAAQKEVVIKHEAIPNYMPAMTMPFEVKDTNELSGLKPGLPVSFRLNVTDTEGWIDQVRSLGPATNTSAGTGAVRQASGVHVVRDVQLLALGDPLPEYHLTNQFGQPLSTTQFKGQALAITFLFTRCPFPTFCPRMANQFAEAQQKLLANASRPTNWHLLTISFDPEFDTPAVLKAYAQNHQYDPKHWSFATGELTDITAIGDQFGLMFLKDNAGSITHNLRTVVIDANGRVRKVFEGSNWTSDELVSELLKACVTH